MPYLNSFIHQIKEGVSWDAIERRVRQRTEENDKGSYTPSKSSSTTTTPTTTSSNSMKSFYHPKTRKQSEEPTAAWTRGTAGFLMQRGIWLQAVVRSPYQLNTR